MVGNVVQTLAHGEKMSAQQILERIVEQFDIDYVEFAINEFDCNMIEWEKPRLQYAMNNRGNREIFYQIVRRFKYSNKEMRKALKVYLNEMSGINELVVSFILNKLGKDRYEFDLSEEMVEVKNTSMLRVLMRHSSLTALKKAALRKVEQYDVQVFFEEPFLYSREYKKIGEQFLLTFLLAAIEVNKTELFRFVVNEFEQLDLTSNNNMLLQAAIEHECDDELIDILIERGASFNSIGMELAPLGDWSTTTSKWELMKQLYNFINEKK